MNREELDAWFAEADDILSDWTGGTDAMRGIVPETEDVEAMPGDSYYEQREPSPILGWSWIQDALADLIDQQFYGNGSGHPQGLLTFEIVDDFTTQSRQPVSDSHERLTRAERALDLRRNRNTGPASRIGLDGIRR